MNSVFGPSSRSARARRAGRIVVICSLLFIAAVTLFPTGVMLRPPPAFCIFCGEYGGIDFTLNTILFIPYGIGLFLFLGKPKRCIAIAFATTLTIELLQLQIITGRDSSLGDLVANTLGATIGVLLSKHWRLWILPTPKRAAILAWASLGGWIGILALSAWAVLPSPTSAVWYGQSIPDLEQFGRFRGTLISASLDGQVVPPGQIPRSFPTYSEFGKGRTFIDATVTPGWRPRTGILAPIVSVFDGEQREMLFLGQKGLSVVFRSRTHSSNLRLREPTVALSNIFPHASPRRPEGRATDGSRMGDTIQLTVLRERDGIQLTVTSPVATQGVRYLFHLFMLWNGLLPFDLSLTASRNILSGLWALGLIFLPVYWFGWQTRRSQQRQGGWFIGIVGACLILLPGAFGLQSSPWWAWVATGAGAVLAIFVARYAKRRVSRINMKV